MVMLQAHAPFQILMQASLVIPVKQLANAKQRLSPLLDTDQRQQLFQAMVEDVLEAATTCDQIDQIVVVTSDTTVASLAQSYGARVLAEPESPGLINAVSFAAATLAAEGAEIMMFLPGDTPLVSVEELDVVLGGMTASSDPQFLIVPAADLGGSNCVVCSPPDCMEFGFGEDSFRRHLSMARERNIEPSIVKLPGIGLDVDTPEDLQELIDQVVQQNVQSHTYHCLLRHGLLLTSEDLTGLTSASALPSEDASFHHSPAVLKGEI